MIFETYTFSDVYCVPLKGNQNQLRIKSSKHIQTVEGWQKHPFIDPSKKHTFGKTLLLSHLLRFFGSFCTHIIFSDLPKHVSVSVLAKVKTTKLFRCPIFCTQFWKFLGPIFLIFGCLFNISNSKQLSMKHALYDMVSLLLRVEYPIVFV